MPPNEIFYFFVDLDRVRVLERFYADIDLSRNVFFALLLKSFESREGDLDVSLADLDDAVDFERLSCKDTLRR